MSKGGIQFDPKAASMIMREEVERARQLIINHIRINGQNASGRTIASLKVEQPSEEETILWGTQAIRGSRDRTKVRKDTIRLPWHHPAVDEGQGTAWQTYPLQDPAAAQVYTTRAWRHEHGRSHRPHHRQQGF